MDRRVAAVGVVAACAVGYGAYTESSADPLYDDERAIAEYADHPPHRMELPPGLVLPEVEAEARVNPQFVAVTMTTDVAQVNGRAVWRLGQPTEPITSAADWAKRLPESVGATPWEVNVAVDARLPFAVFAEVLRAVGRAGFRQISLVVSRPDGALGAVPLPASRRGWGELMVFVRPERDAYRVRATAPFPAGCEPALPRAHAALVRCAEAFLEHTPQPIDSPALTFEVEGTRATTVTDVLDTAERLRSVYGSVTLSAPDDG